MHTIYRIEHKEDGWGLHRYEVGHKYLVGDCRRTRAMLRRYNAFMSSAGSIANFVEGKDYCAFPDMTSFRKFNSKANVKFLLTKGYVVLELRVKHIKCFIQRRTLYLKKIYLHNSK